MAPLVVGMHNVTVHLGAVRRRNRAENRRHDRTISETMAIHNDESIIPCAICEDGCNALGDLVSKEERDPERYISKSACYSFFR